MKYDWQSKYDLAGISLSVLCIIHCVGLPLLILFLPSLLSFKNETFHILMLVAIIPISGYAFFKGYQQHQHHQMILWAILGLTLLLLAPLSGELLEAVFTLSGSIIIVFSHYMNIYRNNKINTGC